MKTNPSYCHLPHYQTPYKKALHRHTRLPFLGKFDNSHKKRPAAVSRRTFFGESRDSTRSVELRLSNPADGAETFLEFVDAALGVHELGETSEEWMGVGSDAD